MKVSANKLNKLICVLVVVAILLIAVNYIFAFYNVNDAFAFNSSNINDSVDIGNLLLDNYSDRNDGKVFNSESMTKLYEKLCGKENATIDDVAKLGVLDAGQIRKKNGNNDIILTIDNKQWTVTYLGVTNETQPQLYITLWLAQAPKDNDGNIATHKWNLWYENNTTSSYKFTSNMYSSSYIRAHALNSGNGYVATNGASSLRSISEDVKIAHEYANLTMSNDKVKDSLISYIIQPSKVGYQSSENHYVDCIGGIGSTLPNDAYGTPHGEVNWYKNSSGTVDMSVLSSKTGYGDWKNDYIWLPSLTETGYSDDLPGIWNLSSAQRSANSETESWLRSGDNGSAQFAFSLNSQGDSFNYPTVTEEYAVRPAFHLNLSAANGVSSKSLSNPADFNVIYDGASKGISSANWYNKDKDIYSNSDKISVTYSDATRTDVGQYTVTLTIKDSSVVWADAKSSADKTRTCTMTILQAEPTVNPIIGNGPYYPGSDMPSITLSSGDTLGSIAWDDGKIADGKTTYNWTFTSSNSNYKNKTGSATLTLSGIEVNAIEASINLPSGTVIYTSTSLDSLKSYLTVTKKNNNGTSAGTAGQDEYVLEGSLTTGESTITVKLKKDGATTNISTTFKVTVVKVELSSITATLSSGSTVYTTTKLDDIKAMLTVTGTNNDGSTSTIEAEQYSINCETANADGTLPSGNNRLTLTLKSNNSIKCDVAVVVSAPNVKSIKAEIVAEKLPNEIYDNTAVNKLKEYIKVVATYDDADGSTKELAANEYVLTGTLVAGDPSYFTVTYGGKTTSVAFTNVVKFEVQSISAVSTQGSKVIYSSASTDDIKGSVMVTGVYNDNTDSVLTPDQFDIVLPEGGLSSTNNTVTIKCGDKTATVTLTITDVISTGIEVEFTDSGNITVDSTAQDLLSGIKITLNYNDGTSEEITPTADMISGDMDSIGDKTITVTYTDPEDSSVTHSDTFTVNIGKGTFDMSNVKFEDKTVTYNGEEHNIEISGDLPEGVSVSYEGNGQIEVNEEGYIVTAKFTHSNPNYNEIPDKTAKLIISNKPVYDMSGVTFEDVTDVVYDGEEHSIELGGLDTLPDGVTYVYVYDEEESSTPFKFTDAGTYEITIRFTGSEEYAPISDKRATLTISAADFDTSTLNFVGSEVVYDGQEHSISIDNLPEWLTVEYEGNGVSEVGEHKVKVKFTHSNGNYNAIADMEVVLKISADEFDVNSLVFEDTVVGYDGKPHSIEIENLPEWLNVEYEGNGQTEIGSYVITAKFTHSNPNYGEISPITATLTIGKGKIAKPIYKGDIRYSGESILPDVSDFDNYIEGVIEIVIDKSEAGVFVGKYTIVFAIVDTEHYEWDNRNSASVVGINKVSVNGNAVLALADEIRLEDNEIAVEWSIGKAKLTATKKDGALPVFSSTSYKGAMDEVITYKYYTDNECTEEIAQEEIVAGQTYYVKASLEDSDNFELDTTAIKFVGTSFSYNAPVGELSTGEKIVQFLKKNWLWLVIALVALLILIIIIVLIARRKKDDNNGKGNNNPPYPPYNGGQPPYPPYNGGQPPYPPYGQQPPYGGQPPYYDRMRAPIMPMAGMIQPQMQGSMQQGMNGAMQPQIGMQQQIPIGMQAQLQGNQIQAIQQPQQVQYVDATSALNAPSHVEAHISDSGVNILVEEVHRLRGEVEHIRSKSEEENIKLRSEVENARAMSAVESAKMQAMAEIERAKNEAKFAMHSGSINEAAATTISNKAGAGDVLGDALMSAVAKMIVQGSINGAGNGAVSNTLNNAQPMTDNANSNVQNNANAIPQCPPGGRMTTTTMVDMTKNSRQAQFSTDDSFM